MTSLEGEVSYLGGIVRVNDVPLALVNQGTAIWVRTYDASPIDVTEKFRMVDPIATLRATRDGAAVLHWRELVARRRDGSEVYHHEARLITWQNKPIVSERYTCNETVTCASAPAWLTP